MDGEDWRLDETLLLNTLMENSADSIYFKDRHCRLMLVSQKMALDLGYAEPSKLVGKTDSELFGKEFGQKTMIDDLHVMESGQPAIGLVESRVLPNGETNWTSTTKIPVRDQRGNVIGLLGITREINELKRVELDLQYLATHDILTGLPNRYLFFDRMEQIIRRAERNKILFAVLYIDLDGFKEINDHYGHDTGDKVLKQIAERLNASVRNSDTVARLGGDEFAIILDAIKKPDHPLPVAQKIRKKIEEELVYSGYRMQVTASIGISLFPIHGSEAATLMKAADHAMYKAKANKNACSVFTPPKIPD